MNKHEYGRLFRLSVRIATIFMLFVFGAGMALVVAIVCGGMQIVSVLFSDLWIWLGRIAVMVVCVLLIGVVDESLR